MVEVEDLESRGPETRLEARSICLLLGNSSLFPFLALEGLVVVPDRRQPAGLQQEQVYDQ
jgi:hypothetical protein